MLNVVAEQPQRSQHDRRHMAPVVRLQHCFCGFVRLMKSIAKLPCAGLSQERVVKEVQRLLVAVDGEL